MLVIRMQRTGRKGHASFRVVVQDSRQAPSSGKVVDLLGSYDPHTKTTTLNKEKAQTFLSNGAQPSDRVVTLLQAEGITIPSWVKTAEQKSRTTRNPDKLRKNQPAAEPEAEAPVAEDEKPEETEAAPEEVAAEEPATPVEAEEAPAETEEA